jgi:hypothetical protein
MTREKALNLKLLIVRRASPQQPATRIYFDPLAQKANSDSGLISGAA